MRGAATAALLPLVRLVLANTRLKRLARRLLLRLPRVHARLQAMLHRAALPPRAQEKNERGRAHLSPRARELHCQLARARAPLRVRRD